MRKIVYNELYCKSSRKQNKNFKLRAKNLKKTSFWRSTPLLGVRNGGGVTKFFYIGSTIRPLHIRVLVDANDLFWLYIYELIWNLHFLNNWKFFILLVPYNTVVIIMIFSAKNFNAYVSELVFINIWFRTLENNLKERKCWFDIEFVRKCT